MYSSEVFKTLFTLLVISPQTMIIPVLVTVSQATFASGSCFRCASRMASEIWSHILSKENIIIGHIEVLLYFVLQYFRNTVLTNIRSIRYPRNILYYQSYSQAKGTISYVYCMLYCCIILYAYFSVILNLSYHKTTFWLESIFAEEVKYYPILVCKYEGKSN